MIDTADPRPVQATSRSHSHGTSVVALSGCALAYASGFMDGSASNIAFACAFVFFLPAYLVLRNALSSAADLPDSELDEREVATRDRAFLLAYQWLGALIAFSGVLAIFDEAERSISWYGPWTAVLLLAFVLPSVMLVRLNPPHKVDA